MKTAVLAANYGLQPSAQRSLSLYVGLNRPGKFAVWFESRRFDVTGLLSIVSLFGFRWRDVSDRPQQSLVVVPVHPIQGGQFDVLAIAP
jgi:hypothetical protein